LSRRHLTLALLLALAVGPYFADLDGSSIWDANEAFYVETPREMIERGDYISPTFNYEPRQNKPVLSYWIVAAFYKAFGISVGVQRLPIALGAMVLIASAFCLAWAAGSIEAGLWAAAGLAITPRLLMFARRIFIDVYISVFMGLTLLFFALAERFPGRRRAFLALMYAAIGLGVLTKGPVAIVLPGAAFFFYLLRYRELPRVRSMMIPAGALIVAAIVVPWYAAVYAREGWEPIWTFVFGENVARYTAGVGVNSSRGPLFYLPVLFSDSFPWSFFLVPAGIAAVRRTPLAATDHASRIRVLCWLWIAVIVLFFTASAAKQDLYIFPIVPAIAALAGLAIASGLDERRAFPRWTAGAIGGVVAAAGAGVLYLFSDGTYDLAGARPMGAAAVAGGLVVAGLAVVCRPRLALLTVIATFVFLDWLFVLRVLPSFEKYKPAPGFAATLAARLKPSDAVVTYDEALPSLVFYLRRHVDPYFDPELLFADLRSSRTVYAILSAENYRQLAGPIGVPTCEIERRLTFDVKLRNMLTREPLPELVLITNRCGPG
jgi:4-amino-4-deoxy-L-arabinose transferase-like glycosyltransferase